MTQFEKIGLRYLLVSRRGKTHKTSRMKEMPRSNCMVKWSETQYINSKGKRTVYPFACISIGSIYVKVPEELIGKRVEIELKVLANNPRLKRMSKAKGYVSDILPR